MPEAEKYDLTVGSIRKNIIRLSIPMIIANAGQYLYNLVDIYFVAKLGKVAVAATSMTGMIIMMIFTVNMGLSIATQAMVARFYGSKKYFQVQQAILSSFLWGLLGSVAIAIVGIFGAEFLFRLIGAPAEVAAAGLGYMRIMFVGMVFNVFFFIGNASFHGAGNSKTPMIVGLLGVFVNIVLDPLLIFGIGPFPVLGIDGAAYATVIARFVAMFGVVYMLVRDKKIFRFSFKDMHPDTTLIKETFRIGMPGAAQLGIRSLSYVAFMRIAAFFGTSAVAAMGVCFRINMFVLLPTFAVSAAVGSMVGQNLGAEKVDRAKKSAKGAAFAVAGYLWTIGFIAIFFGQSVLSHFLHETPLILGYMFLLCLSCGYAFSAFGITFNGTARGAGDTIMPLIIISLAYFLGAVPAAYFMSRTFLGVEGVFIGYFVGMVLYSTMMSIYFRSGRWIRHRISAGGPS